VRAVLDDVPHVDYTQQLNDMVQTEAASKLPLKIKAVYADITLRSYLDTQWVSSNCRSDDLYFSTSVYAPTGYAVSDELWKRMKPLLAAREKQSDTRSELSRKLDAVVRGISTVKALRAALPEFEKYAPAEEAPPSRSLPVVANVVADFVNAGWPKGQPRVAGNEKPPKLAVVRGNKVKRIAAQKKS
jgi:hypothetical protein